MVNLDHYTLSDLARSIRHIEAEFKIAYHIVFASRNDSFLVGDIYNRKGQYYLHMFDILNVDGKKARNEFRAMTDYYSSFEKIKEITKGTRVMLIGDRMMGYAPAVSVASRSAEGRKFLQIGKIICPYLLNGEIPAVFSLGDLEDYLDKNYCV